MSLNPKDDLVEGHVPGNGKVLEACDGVLGAEKKPTISLLNRDKKTDTSLFSGSSMLATQVDQTSNVPAMGGSVKAFSSSLPALLRKKSNVVKLVVDARQAFFNGEVEGEEASELLDDEIIPNTIGARQTFLSGEVEGEASELLDDEIVPNTIGDLLPDEEELFAGIVNSFDLLNLTNNKTEEAEEFDLFSCGGGMELDGDTQDSLGMYFENSRGSINGFSGPSIAYHGSSNVGAGSIIGEHPFGEHPSRTLFVRNINSNVEDAELRTLFEHYGAIRTLYTACKHRGFVMISYYDIRSARNAMRALQNKPLRRRKLDIHFSIPKDNPSDKDVNQGTLVVFNLDASVSNEDLRQIFGHYGEVKEIRETPHKRHHKFIEFYDVRAAEAALKALNRSDIAGKRIKLEPSRPGGARRSLVQQHGPDSEQDDNPLYGFNSPVTLSPPADISSWTQFGSPFENSPLRSLYLALGTMSPSNDKLVSQSNSLRVGTIGSHLGRMSSVDNSFSSTVASVGVKTAPPYRAHSLPDYGKSTLPFLKPPVPVPARGVDGARSTYDVVDSVQLPRSTSGEVDYASLYEQPSGAVGVPGGGSFRRLSSGSSGAASLSGSQFLWGQSSSYQPSPALSGWPATPPIAHNFHPGSHGQLHVPPRPFMYTGSHGRSPVTVVPPPHRFQLGSAPSADSPFLQKQFGFRIESPDMNYHFSSNSLGPTVVHGTVGSPSSVLSMNMNGAHAMLNPGSLGSSGGRYESGSSPGVGMPPHRRNHMFQTSGIALSAASDGQVDRGRIRRRESSAIQLDCNRQYQLDIDRILRGEDTRTTLMIKNIPNKYTSKMLLAAIDEHHRKTYDFLYLPIDFKNKCNVGYAFINMTSPAHIIPLYQAFNGKKWEKFNSEKVASLAYARIQGKAALVAHFQNSSLMNEDKRCRPILFDAEGPDMSEQDQASLGGSMSEMAWREGETELLEATRQNSIGESVILESITDSSAA